MTDDDTSPRTGRFAMPHRSVGDRKIAGVAGGIGRALAIDPVVIRVLFVILAIFGGSGVLLYCLAWLFLPADGDEVSAAEALAGRGKSSVSPALAVALIIVGVASAGSAFSWGIGFWPVAIAAIVVFALLAHRRADSGQRADWAARADDLAEKIGGWGERIGQRAGAWGSRVGDQVSEWAGGPRARDATRGEARDTAATAPETAGASGAATSAAEPTTEPVPSAAPDPADLLADDRTPPAWDPLGAAPFAWDLPEPGPDPSLAVAGGEDAGSPRRFAVSQLVLGLVLIVGATLSALTATGHLSLSWAAVAGLTLGVLATGLVVVSLLPVRGRGLIGPGIFLTVVTLALAVTGLRGTDGFGDHTWAPATVEQVADSYTWNAGQSTLDLSGLVIPEGEELSTTVTVNAGRAMVILPTGTSVTAVCESRLGSINCLGTRSSGVRPGHTVSVAGAGNRGHLDIAVTTNAGSAVVRHGGQ